MKLAFSALPVDVQTKYNPDYIKGIEDLNAADAVLVAICKAGTPPTPTQLDAIAQAVQAFLTAMEPIFSGSSVGQAQMAKVHEKSEVFLQDLGR
jgi:hypothetical protein